MEYLVGLLLGVIGVLLFNRGRPPLTPKEEQRVKDVSSEISSNKEQVKQEEEKLNAPSKKEKKSLSDLVEYFKRFKS